MYSYDERMRAIAIYIRYDRTSATTIRELGYPTRKALYRWYREYEQSGDHYGEYRKTHEYSALQKQIAVAYYFEQGRSLSATRRAVGYPSSEMLGNWIDEVHPRSRKVPLKQGSAVSFSVRAEAPRGHCPVLTGQLGCIGGGFHRSEQASVVPVEERTTCNGGTGSHEG